MEWDISMEELVEKQYHILFLCLDTLRYDAAVQAQQENKTPCLNQYGSWVKCQAPGNFTYPSHQAMFAGFMPLPFEAKSSRERKRLFFPKNVGLGRKPPQGAFCFEGPTWVHGLAQKGYDTYCIGGVSFFDKRSPIGAVMPSYFQHSYWNPSFACPVKENTQHQVELAIRKIKLAPQGKPIMMYININAIHYPNYFYLEGEKKDGFQTHMEALAYADSKLPPLFQAFQEKGDTFVICTSDHGTCYGEDGCTSHGINHPAVNTIPYKHFIMPKSK